MDFKKFLPEEVDNTKEEIENSEIIVSKILKADEKINQNQFYGIITSKKSDWQNIIYDLIHTEQLDPWDIDILILSKRYFERILELEDDPDFYISSKVLLAASLLLRIKSEFLLNKHIQSIDDILFGKKEETRYVTEKIEIDEDDLPILMPKTPLPRLRRVTLPELMAALNKAINTESRRIKREVAIKRAHKLSQVDIPTFRRIDLKDRIKQFYARILTSLKKNSISDKKESNKIAYSNLIGTSREEKLATFLPLLHLSNSQRLWLEQEVHLEEIWIYLYEYFNKNSDKFIEELEEDIEEMKQELESAEEGIESVEGENLSGLEKARLKREENKRMQEEIAKELAEELGIEIQQDVEDINKEKKIDSITGFSEELV